MLLEDVEYFLEKTKAKECFDMLDLDKDGKVSLQVWPPSFSPCHVLRCADKHWCCFFAMSCAVLC